MGEDFEDKLRSIVEEINKLRKRVLKKETPKNPDIHIEVINSIIVLYNNFVKLIAKNWKNLSLVQQESCKNYSDRIRDKTARAFQALNCIIKIPTSIFEEIDTSVLQTISKQLKMATSMNDFFNFASKVLPTEFNGEASKLKSFLDSLDLLQINATGNEENAILLIKTRLTGKTRSLITTENSIIETRID